MKVSREEVQQLVKKSNQWFGCYGSGSGFNWDGLGFENEDGKEMFLSHDNGTYYVDGYQFQSTKDFLDFLNNL
jgi:hypothetical protein